MWMLRWHFFSFLEKELMMIWGVVCFKSTILKRLIEWHYKVKKNIQRWTAISWSLLFNCVIIVLHLDSCPNSCRDWGRLDDLMYSWWNQTANVRLQKRQTAPERTNQTTERKIKPKHRQAFPWARLGCDCLCLLFTWLFEYKPDWGSYGLNL